MSIIMQDRCERDVERAFEIRWYTIYSSKMMSNDSVLADVPRAYVNVNRVHFKIA